MTDDNNIPTSQDGGWRQPLIIGGVVVVVLILLVAALAATGFFDGGGTPAPIETPAPGGPGPAPQAAIKIEQPVNGSVLDIPNAIRVSGTGQALPEGNVVVQAVDDQGNLLVTQPTTLQGENVGTGGAGTWSVDLVIPVQPGTTGQIIAFSDSPADGSRLAEDRVNVTFGEKVTVAAEITIDQPENDTVLDIPNTIQVSGTGQALPEGNVVVQALDAQGNPLVTQPTILQGENVGTGGAGTWSVDLVIPVQPGTTGQIIAFSDSPADGSRLAEDRVNVVYGEKVVMEPQIRIEQPTAGASLDTGNPVRVSGSGQGLFEGNVVVRALDAGGNVLVEVPTSLQGTDAGMGGPGTWSVDLSIPAGDGSQGRIVAFSPSPQSGDNLASDEISVTYGESQPQGPSTVEGHLWVLSSLNGQATLPETMITAQFENGTLAGTSGCNNYSASYESTDSQLTVGPAATTRKMCPEPSGVMDQESGYLAALSQAATYSTARGILEVFDAQEAPILIYDAAVIGTVTYLPRIALTPEAVLKVELQDISLQDVPATVLGRQVIENPGQVPIPFIVTYDATQIVEGHTYSIAARIEDPAGTLAFINTSVNFVITRGYPSQIEVQVDPVN